MFARFHLKTRFAASGALLLLAACATAATSGSDAIAEPATAASPASAPSWLYVCNQNDASVSVIDMSTNRVVRTIDLTTLGFSANAKPHHIAVEPDGSAWYVTLIGDGKIVKLDRNDRVMGQAAFETPGMLALHPSQDLLFVGRSMTAVNPPPRIGIVRRSNMSIEEVDVFFPRPHAMVLVPTTGTVYTASLAVNQMAAVNVQAEEVKLTSVDGPPHALMQFAVSPDGGMLVASGELSRQVLFFDISEPMQPRFVASVEVGAQPFDPIFTPDGKWIYLGNKAANTVTIIDAESRRVAKVVHGEGIAQPHGTAASPDGRFVYVSNNNLGGNAHAMHRDTSAAAASAMPAPAGGPGTIVAIDTRTQEIAAVIPVGRNAAGIAVATPRQ
jgi:YVTN family beta-propeller protein